MKELATIFISVFLMLVLIKGLVWTMSLQCRAKAQKQELVYEYGLLQGCMIKNNGKWIDYEKYITIKE